MLTVKDIFFYLWATKPSDDALSFSHIYNCTHNTCGKTEQLKLESTKLEIRIGCKEYSQITRKTTWRSIPVYAAYDATHVNVNQYRICDFQ